VSCGAALADASRSRSLTALAFVRSSASRTVSVWQQIASYRDWCGRGVERRSATAGTISKQGNTLPAFPADGAAQVTVRSLPEWQQ